MANRVAPPKSTGGGGFEFETDVGASFLVSMLVGHTPFGPELGQVTRVSFQTQADGWFLDDILLETASPRGRHRIALSLKSNPQFTAKRAPRDFVEAAWRQWLHVDSDAFDRNADYLGMVTTRLSLSAADARDGLLHKARTGEPTAFSNRLSTPRWSNKKERALFESFRCPAELGLGTPDADPTELLQRLQFVEHDFDRETSESRAAAVLHCRRAVRSGSQADALSLWTALREVAARLRVSGGSVALPSLFERLRGHVALSEHPDYREDWAQLDRRAFDEVRAVRDTVAGEISIPRDLQFKEALDALARAPVAALVGPSGIGKSALARRVFETRRAEEQRTLWIDAASFRDAGGLESYEARLGLSHRLPELLSAEPSESPLVVVDRVEQVIDAEATRTLGRLLRWFRVDEKAGPWTVLLVCQEYDWERLQDDLFRSPDLNVACKRVDLGAVARSDLQAVVEGVPTLRPLLDEPRVAAVLGNLKLLDLVVRRVRERGPEADGIAPPATEADVAEWFWRTMVARGERAAERTQAVSALAIRLADELTNSVNVADASPEEARAWDSLVRDRLVRRLAADRVGFDHDVYGDWVRVHELGKQGSNLCDFLRERQASPLWHRAIRLFGIALVSTEESIASWRRHVSALDEQGLGVARDLLLDAPVLSPNDRRVLDNALSGLVVDDGRLLKRVLTRFLSFATAPDEVRGRAAQSAGVDEATIRVALRRPRARLWPCLLEWLHSNATHVLRLAPREVAQIVKLWLESSTHDSAYRTEMAGLAVRLGRHALATRDSAPSAERKLYYACMLLAANERTDSVVVLTRSAAQLGPATAVPSDVAVWPGGPHSNVDDAFREEVLSPMVSDLVTASPADAQAVILATLIEAPAARHVAMLAGHAWDFGLAPRDQWTPASFVHGPFLTLLKRDFNHGLELVVRLVEFATARSLEQRVRATRGTGSVPNLTQLISRASAGDPSIPCCRLLAPDKAGGARAYVGDAQVYLWGSAIGNGHPAVAAALMSLEQYFYSQLEAGEPVDDKLEAVLARSQSAAVLGTLAEVGKSEPRLLAGPLLPLLSGAELYWWEGQKRVGDPLNTFFGTALHSKLVMERIEAFRDLEHRPVDVRQLASGLLLNVPAVDAYLRRVLPWWTQQSESGALPARSVEQLRLWLDRTNWSEDETPEGERCYRNRALDALRSESVATEQTIRTELMVFQLPLKCRQILRGTPRLTAKELDSLWDDWLRVRQLAARGGATAAPSTGEATAVLAVSAVFLWHSTWLQEDQRRAEEVEQVVRAWLTRDLPDLPEFWGKHDVSPYSWDCFLVDCAVMLMASAPRDPLWRRVVSQWVFCKKYTTVGILFTRCARLRMSLRGDFGSLCRLALVWAHARPRLEFARRLARHSAGAHRRTGERILEALDCWQSEQVAAFVDAQGIEASGNWSEWTDRQELDDLLTDNDLPRRSWQIDWGVARASHAWLLMPRGLTDDSELEYRRNFWQAALLLLSKRPMSLSDGQVDRYPFPDERWVLDGLAAEVLAAQDDTTAEAYVEGIVALPADAHPWPERFLSALHRIVLSEEHVPRASVERLRRTVARFCRLAEGAPRWPEHARAWRALIGIDASTCRSWGAQHASLVRSAWPTIALWMEHVPPYDRHVLALSQWLAGPACDEARVRALPWLNARVVWLHDQHDGGHEELCTSVARLLNVIWGKHRDEIHSAPEFRSAFSSLLGLLVEQQNPWALELQDRIGGLGAMSSAV